MGTTEMSPEYIFLREIIGGPFIEISTERIKYFAKLIIAGITPNDIESLAIKYRHDSPEKRSQAINHFVTSRTKNIPENARFRKLVHDLTIAVYVHELGHLSEHKDVLEAYAKYKGIFAVYGRIVETLLAHKSEYRQAFNLDEDVFQVKIEDDANERLESVMKELGTNIIDIRSIMRGLQNRISEGVYTEWQIWARIIVLGKSIFALFSSGLFFYFLGKITKKIFMRRTTSRISSIRKKSRTSLGVRTIGRRATPYRSSLLKKQRVVARESFFKRTFKIGKAILFSFIPFLGDDITKIKDRSIKGKYQRAGGSILSKNDVSHAKILN